MSDEALAARARALGIASGFHDISGAWHEVRPEVLTRLIAAMGEEVPVQAPKPCADEPAFLPPAIMAGKKLWGLAVQLYGLTSQRNWGIGDFGDLEALLSIAADSGAAAVQLNPLHALFRCYPDHVSPYAPSSRLFLNPLYIDVEAVDDLAECGEVDGIIHSENFRATLARLRAANLVDYEGVAACKMPILARLFESFRDHHLSRGETNRTRDFAAFRASGGGALESFAMFEALSHHFADTHPGGWRTWPRPFQDPRSEEVRRFTAAHSDGILLSIYLQWVAHKQLCRAAATARRLGMAIGIVADIAIGCDSAGADAWGDQHLVALDAEIGAPPDPFCAEGQTWGTPPWRPQVLRGRGYAPLRALLDHTKDWAGGLRIDHAIGLARQYWVPRGLSGRDGAYVAYPRDELIAEIAAWSRHCHCLVIGEDLGTVPAGFSDRLRRSNILTTCVLAFERNPDGSFRPSAAYPRLSCACAGTHDLPPLAGFVEGRDIVTRAAIAGEGVGLGAALAERRYTLDALRARLGEEGLLAQPDGAGPITAAVHGFLAKSGSALAFAQMEDVLGLSDQVNLPGTVSEHPNWRRKYPVPIEDFRGDGRLADTAALFRRHGRQ